MQLHIIDERNDWHILKILPQNNMLEVLRIHRDLEDYSSCVHKGKSTT